MRATWILAMTLTAACTAGPLTTRHVVNDATADVALAFDVAASMHDCVSTAEVRCVTAARVRAYDVREDQVIGKARRLAHVAGIAARAGDCARVRELELQVDALPAVHIEGGLRETVFRRDPDVERCVR